MCSHQPVGNALSARGFNLESHSWTFSPKQSCSVTNSLEIAHIPFQQQLCHLFLTPKGLCRKTGLFHGCRVCLGRLLQTQGKSNSASPDTSDEGMKAPSPWNWGPITSKIGLRLLDTWQKNPPNCKTCFLQTTRKLSCLGSNNPPTDLADKHQVRVCTSFG